MMAGSSSSSSLLVSSLLGCCVGGSRDNGSAACSSDGGCSACGWGVVSVGPVWDVAVVSCVLYSLVAALALSYVGICRVLPE